MSVQEASHQVLDSAAAAAESAPLDDFAERLQMTVSRAFESQGERGEAWANFLNGTWLGHPLHPVLTDLPIGFWNSSVALDMLEMLGARRMGAGADATLTLGLAAALAAAAAGLADYQHVSGEAKRVGATHAILNSAATALFGASLLLRRRGNRGGGKLLSLAGVGVATYSAYLGGNLVYKQRIGTNHAPRELPGAWAVACAERDLPEGTPTRCEAGDVPAMVVREGGEVFALADVCAHLGGPLSEGEIRDGCVRCPWHGSTFELADGRVVRGPSAFNQPAFETRLQSGYVELRGKPSPSES